MNDINDMVRELRAEFTFTEEPDNRKWILVGVFALFAGLMYLFLR